MNISLNNINETVNEVQFKRQGEILIPSAVFYIIAVILLASAAYLNWPTIRDFFRSGEERLSLWSIQSAASMYSSFRADGAVPSSISDLLTGVSASDSVDGVDHVNLLGNTGRWKSGQQTDAWGTDYVFTTDSDGTHKIISCGPDKTQGTDDDLEVTY